MKTYNNIFFKSHQTGSKKSANKIVPLIIESIRPKSIVDVGCGTGDWLSVFQENGISNILGLDGNYVDKHLLAIPDNKFIPTDLEESIVIDRTFDLALSLEVAEHLKPERAQRFIADLVKMAPVIVFSAAIPGQGGTNHLNEQWPNYWGNIFNHYNYVALDYIRKQIWEDEDVEWWYAQNIIVYINRNLVHNYKLPKVNDIQNNKIMSIVHPRLFSKVNLSLSRSNFLKLLSKIIKFFN